MSTTTLPPSPGAASPNLAESGGNGEELPVAPPPAVWGGSFLRACDNIWLRLDRCAQYFVPAALNPFGQLGAIANTCLLIAVVSGVALLLWYTPSVHQAYDSLEAIRQSSWLGQLTRSLHRYSSDGCLFFVLLHAARILCQGRFTGARWLAWTTGICLLALLWFIGWTGYWLVWDVRGQHTALGTARFIDRLPIFAEPLSRTFLTDQSVHSLLFFLIFFVHMLAPLAIGVGIWMHLMRLNRSRFLTGRAMTLWIVGSLLICSVGRPATSADRAQMTRRVPDFSIDWWYLWPLALTDRLGGGMLWTIFLGGGIVIGTMPWWMARRRRAPEWKAQVDLPRCMGCTLCAQDCPFNAIAMIPREDGRKFPVQSQVNPDLCVGCGICAGACDSQAINLPALPSRDIEKRLHVWIDAEKARGETPFIAFCCGESAGGMASRDDFLPGFRVETVPCAGWVSAVILERAIQRGAAGILVVGCSEAEPTCREGMKWFQARMEGKREPAFNPGKADPAQVQFLKLDRGRSGELQRRAREFRDQRLSQASAPHDQPFSHPSPLVSIHGSLRSIAEFRPLLGGILLASILGAVVLILSDLPYRTPHSLEPELIVSFNHSGAILEPRQLTKEELAKRLPHMRAQVNVSRQRLPVRLRVQIDGAMVLDHAYPPKGLSKDGPSTAVARLPMKAGSSQVTVQIADGTDPEQWTRTWTETLLFEPGRARVVLFDTKSGFTAH